MMNAMPMQGILTLILALAGALAIGGTPARAIEPPRAVVELFTSQGCSSCPPADAFMGKLSTADDLITLTFPVDYWDYLGWRDTLASRANSTRQREYARERGDGAVYTPQIVINGRSHIIGSDRKAVASEIERQGIEGKAPSVPVTIEASEKSLAITIGNGPPPASGEATLWLAAFMARATVRIGNGENRGRTITYYHVVRSLRPIGMWMGKTVSLVLPKKEIIKDGIDGLAVLLQEDSHGRPSAILGAAAIDMSHSRSD